MFLIVFYRKSDRKQNKFVCEKKGERRREKESVCVRTRELAMCKLNLFAKILLLVLHYNIVFTVSIVLVLIDFFVVLLSVLCLLFSHFFYFFFSTFTVRNLNCQHHRFSRFFITIFFLRKQSPHDSSLIFFFSHSCSDFSLFFSSLILGLFISFSPFCVFSLFFSPFLLTLVVFSLCPLFYFCLRWIE